MTVQSCPHKEDGWCLSCAEEMVDDLDKTLVELHTRRENFEIMTKRLIEKENELAALIAEVKKLRAHLSPDGEYAIRRADGGAMFITETMLLGDIMDNIDAMLEWDVTPKELSTPAPQ